MKLIIVMFVLTSFISATAQVSTVGSELTESTSQTESQAKQVSASDIKTQEQRDKFAKRARNIASTLSHKKVYYFNNDPIEIP